MTQIASENAPSPMVVVPHYIFGGLTLLIVSLLIVFHPEAFTQHFFNPKLLAISHLLALGWISMIIFGALYQLLPVILEVKQRSPGKVFLCFAECGNHSSGAFILEIFI